MRSGLYPLAVVAEFLGQRVEQMRERIELDGLPAVAVPCAGGEQLRVALSSLHRWLQNRSHGEPLTLLELADELERCEAAVQERHRAKYARAKARKERRAA